ncbi:MAG: hypothetical protein GQ565_10775 [Candidatus Aegiribacteria sp.]|nr:hypothetical protein [Candidatus Aegiribacteria sp.]
MMSKYFWLRESWVLDHTGVVAPEIEEEIDFFKGQLIDGQGFDKPLVFETSYKSGARPHHYFDYATSIPVVSGLFVEALGSVGIDNFQLFPAVLRNSKEGVEWENYFAFNVLGMVDATDLASSQYSEIMKGNREGMSSLGSFTVLALKREKTQGLFFFREPHAGCLVMAERQIRDLLRSQPEEGFGLLCHEVIMT